MGSFIINCTLPSPPSPPPKKRRSRLWIAAIIVLVIILVANLFYFRIIPWPFVTKEEIKGDVIIDYDVPVTATSGSVDNHGGTIAITNSSNPLYGLRVEVPEAATSETITFTISYANINNITGLPENASVVSELIKIETSGSERWNESKAFDLPVLVTLPYDPDMVLPDTDVVRFYYYDSQTNILDAAGFLYETPIDHTITFYTASFSELVGIRLYFEYGLGWLFGEYSADTGFRPKKDGWFMPNCGSYLRFAGTCGGMACYAKWFHRHKSVSNWIYGAWVATGTNLYDKYREGIKDQWRDDATAIELATRAQIAAEPVFRAIFREKKYLVADVSSPNMYDSRRVALTWLHGMIVTHTPQLVGLGTQFVNGELANGHMVLTYRYVNGRFDIYDPNYPGTYPGTDARQIPFNWGPGFSRTYSSSSMVGVQAREFNLFFAFGTKVFGSPRFYQGLYEAADKGFKDNSIFPTVKFTSASTEPQGTTPEDTDGDGTRDTALDKATITGTISGGQKGKVGNGWIFVADKEFIVSVSGDYPEYTFTVEVPLYQGDNDIFFLASFDKHGWWAGFLKDKIRCTASRSNLTITLWWDQDQSDVDLHVLEPAIENTEGRHIYYDNRGGEGQYPYLDMDDTNGNGPEHYLATESMTLPNYKGEGKWLYGTYKVRVHYFADHDDDLNRTQPITWHLHARYLAFRVSQTGEEKWIEKSTSGSLTVANMDDTDNFYNSDSSWSQIWPIEYEEPDIEKYNVPPPPQNKLPT